MIIKVMQHVIPTSGMGGTLTEYKRLVNSELSHRYCFVPLVQTISTKNLGFNLMIDLYKKIKRENPDILHIRGLQSEGFFCLLAGKMAGCKNIVVCVHGFYFDRLEISKLKNFIFRRIIEPLTLRFADCVYCVCDYAVKRDIIQKNAKHLFGFIHNSAPDFSDLDRIQMRKEFRNNLNITDNNIVITTIGRISKDKGFDILIEVIKKLKVFGDLIFLIVGDGPYLEYTQLALRSEIEAGKVIFTGKTNEVSAALFGSDIFAFPTFHENLSFALLEACAASLPSVVTNVGGNPEIIVDGETGLLVPANNSDEFVLKLKTLIESQSLRIEMGTKSRIRVKTVFSESSNLIQIEKIYKSFLLN